MSPAAKSAARAMSSLERANAVEAVNIRLSRELLDLVDRHAAERCVSRSVAATDMLSSRIGTTATRLACPIGDRSAVQVKLQLPTVLMDVIRARAANYRRSLRGEIQFLLALATEGERAQNKEGGPND